jgi:hypothetical protein
MTGATGETEPATVQNISLGGVSLILRTRLEPGTIIDIDLSHTLRDFDCQIPMRVVHVSEFPDGNMVVGGSFTRPLTPEEFQGLI